MSITSSSLSKASCMMDGFGLLIGHLIGDFILQNDWLAKNKANPCAGEFAYGPDSRPSVGVISDDDMDRMRVHVMAFKTEWIGHLACTVHCLLYTFAVWVCSWPWMPWWGLVACFTCHWFIDRFAIAGRWMRNVSGQKFFASKEHPMWPNGIILVDNTFHLITLYVIGIIHFGV